MKLLTPTIGWAATDDTLFWTTDGGTQWKDVTPPNSSHGRLSAVCFLNANVGSVLLSHQGKLKGPNFDQPEPTFDLATTTNAGTSWSVKPLEVQDPDPGRGLSDQAWIDFVDSAHGWVMVQLNSGTAVSIGVLLTTNDGGGTWKLRKSPPIAGPVHFVTTNDGWLAGGPDQELYFTSDAGENWQQVSLSATPEAGSATFPYTYHLPVFENAKHGFLEVDYVAPGGSTSALVLYATDDGGHTWLPNRTLPRVNEIHGGAQVVSTVADSVLISAASSDSRMSLAVVRSGGEVSKSSAEVSTPTSALLKLSFIDSNHGWALTSTGELLATADGATSWSRITPAPVAAVPSCASTRPRDDAYGHSCCDQS